jgi:hypothetical protein
LGQPPRPVRGLLRVPRRRLLQPRGPAPRRPRRRRPARSTSAAPPPSSATAKDDAGNLSAEVLCHSWLSHSAQELKRLLVAAEAYWRAIDLGYLKSDELDTPGGQRAGLLLLLAGLLEFPADPNLLDGLWESALDMLQLPRLSRTVVRRCIDDADHEHGNYYGSERGIAALLGTDKTPGAIQQTSPVAHDELVSGTHVGRARPLQLPIAPPRPPPPV